MILFFRGSNKHKIAQVWGGISCSRVSWSELFQRWQLRSPPTPGVVGCEIRCSVWPATQHQPVMCSWSQQQRRSNTERRTHRHRGLKTNRTLKKERKNQNSPTLCCHVLTSAFRSRCASSLFNQSRSRSLQGWWPQSEHMEQLCKHLITPSRKALEGETRGELNIQPQKPDCLWNYISC